MVIELLQHNRLFELEWLKIIINQFWIQSYSESQFTHTNGTGWTFIYQTCGHNLQIKYSTHSLLFIYDECFSANETEIFFSFRVVIKNTSLHFLDIFNFYWFCFRLILLFIHHFPTSFLYLFLLDFVSFQLFLEIIIKVFHQYSTGLLTSSSDRFFLRWNFRESSDFLRNWFAKFNLWAGYKYLWRMCSSAKRIILNKSLLDKTCIYCHEVDFLWLLL